MTANSNNELLWNALLDNNNMQYAVRIKAINKGGNISNDGGRLIVKNADEVLILLTADTDYKENFDPDFNDPKHTWEKTQWQTQANGWNRPRQRIQPIA